MESRISKIEAIIPMLATREDLAKHEGLMREELANTINAQTWKIIIWVTGVFAMSTATSLFVAMQIR